MTRDEMILKAQQVRARNSFPPATEGELAALPAEETLFHLETAGHTVPVYRISPKRGLIHHCPMIINFHGGGYMKGRFDRDRIYCSHLSDSTGTLVWDVDYSLAPEAPFPTAVEEAAAVVRYAFDHAGELDVDPQHIFLTGHSAGGGLVAAVCQLLAGEAGHTPAAVMMEYLPADMATDPVSKLTPEQLADDRERGRAETGRLYNQFYTGDADPHNPLISPLFADSRVLGQFPDSLVITAGLDPLCEEGEQFALRLAQSGVRVTLRQFLQSPHGFTINRMGEWEQSLAMQAEFLLDHIG